MKILFGTYTRKESEGIYTIHFDEEKLECHDYNLSHKIENPTYLDIYHDYVFSVSSKDDRGGVALFKKNALISQVLNQNVPPCYVSYDSYHQLLYSANYHQGMINTYRLNHGNLEAHETIVFDAGSKAHYVHYLKAFNVVFVCDLGLDRAYVFRVDEEQRLHLRQTINFPQGSGPRHAICHPHQPYCYVVSELSYEVFVLHFDDHEFKRVNQLPANPSLNTKDQHGAAIKISSDGKFLYTSNRRDNSISVFKINEYKDLELIQNASTHGDHPRDFEISPDQKYIVVANLVSDSCTLLARDAYSGKLTLVQKNVGVHEPVCVRFK
ncbi:MAG: lactonase family protein [Erysipelothrix sp.]|nr:lactonase family protein [Erysipelothrix sp.]